MPPSPAAPPAPAAGPRRRLLQALLLLMAYSGVAMNDPSKGSLLLQLQNSWLRAHDDLASSNLVWSNRQQLVQAADLQRLRNEQQVREALCVLRQAGEAPGSSSRHRGDPPPGSLRLHRASRIGTLRARILSPPEPMAAFAAAAMLPERPPPPP